MDKNMNSYDIYLGDMVYLKTDKEQLKRIVVAITQRESGYMFCLAQSTSETWHYGMEISKERDIILATSN